MWTKSEIPPKNSYFKNLGASAPPSNFRILNLFSIPLYIHEWCLLVKTRSFYGQVVGPPGGQANFPKKGSPVLPLRGHPQTLYFNTRCFWILGVHTQKIGSISSTVWGWGELQKIVPVGPHRPPFRGRGAILCMGVSFHAPQLMMGEQNFPGPPPLRKCQKTVQK